VIDYGYKTKREAERVARKYEREDHAAGLTERKWGVVENPDRERAPRAGKWAVKCLRDDPRHTTEPAVIPGLNAPRLR
jgi:hypothetical protein